MNEEVRRAVEAADAAESKCMDGGKFDGWQTIRAELTRLTEIADAVDPLVIRLGEVTTELERLRDQVAQSHRDLMDERYSVQAHLSEPRT